MDDSKRSMIWRFALLLPGAALVAGCGGIVDDMLAARTASAIRSTTIGNAVPTPKPAPLKSASPEHPPKPIPTPIPLKSASPERPPQPVPTEVPTR